MNDEIIQQHEAAIKRLDALIESLRPIRDVLTAGEPEQPEIDRRLRRAQADRTDAAQELAHLRAISKAIPPLTDDERAEMRRQLEELDSRLRETQTLQAWISFADAVITIAGEQRAKIRGKAEAA